MAKESNAQPWVEMLINERFILTDLAGILTANGWTKVDEFTKIVYPTSLTKPAIKKLTLPQSQKYVDLPEMAYNSDVHIYLDEYRMSADDYTTEERENGGLRITFNPDLEGSVEIYYSTIKSTDEIEFHVAKHIIVRNVSGNEFGMALYTPIRESIRKIREKVPFAIPSKNATKWDSNLEPQDEGVFEWVEKIAEDFYEKHTLYFYQLERYVATGNFLVGWDNPKEQKRMALDIEIQQSMWDKKDDGKVLEHVVSKKQPLNFQSPITVARTRLHQLEETISFAEIRTKLTNWWEDSKIRARGFVDSKSAMLILLADTAPIWDRNAVPSIPIYMGDFDKTGEDIETVHRSFTYDFYRTMQKKGTIVSTKPVTNRGSTVKVWATGDLVSPDLSKSIRLEVDGREIKQIETPTHEDPSNVDKDSAYFVGEFSLTGLQGKSTVDFSLTSTGDVSRYHPIAARVWLEFTIQTSNEERSPSALFAGTASYSKSNLETALKESATFDYNDFKDSNQQEIILPMLKEYPHYPSNGIDSIMVKRTKFGARYQAHYLLWNVTPNAMPPDRVGIDGGMHPRAWQNAENPAYNYQFNPSRYSDKAHTSKATIVHPEDGKYGTLRNVILVSPLTIMNGDELREVDKHCEGGVNQYKIYSYYLIEGISPLTKRPSTAYVPAGLGILKDGYTLPPTEPEPTPLEVTISPIRVVTTIGEVVDLTVAYSTHSPFIHYNWIKPDSASIISFNENDVHVSFSQEGTYTVTFTITNAQGQKGSATATVEVKASS
ncbi:PKD domain-containing protein [Brevibacillus laterosporus]|uniref:PKD domain-containing protein n=1 Tax=Brevibacillus laterosporus TaxID=1465 RepID=UPI000CE56BAE|nr:PKD domain-containing protein [Brevibacillus laterosporus]MED1666049.1 PKD domain-containing protein [Brevibacillus laterosporus]MED1667830.1 PKD domain-containing protein [Brevibacillus laterosporus]MED1719619.1 PKD domain-containing protein [Brevibacillus laterosporus]PPA89970.1 hypothetical protein C4A76_00385 [Brevibacillus laterosporus]